MVGAVTVGLIGCVSCLNRYEAASVFVSPFNLITGALVGWVVGGLTGALLGQSADSGSPRPPAGSALKRTQRDKLSSDAKLALLQEGICPECGCDGIEVTDSAYRSWESTDSETRQATISNSEGDETATIEYSVDVPVTHSTSTTKLRCWFCAAEYEHETTS